MTLCLDTSALMPYYRQEASSDQVQDLLQRQTEPVLISQLTQVEFASALARWVRVAELSERQANRVEAAFYEDVEQGRYIVKALTPDHYIQASRWLLARKTSLRTLDALQLACSAAMDATLVCLDATLCQAARYLGVRVMGPDL